MRLFHLAPSLAFLTTHVSAHQDSLFTSSVSYCALPQAIIIQQFDISYVAENDSVVFDVTAASVEADLTVSANVLLNFYGSNPINLTFDFCNDLGNVLCPLPLYNFSGSGSVPLPSVVNVGGRVPPIAYKIPDLEAFAQVILTDVKTGAVKACVQTTLSNGWSTHQSGVAWATGGLAIGAFLLCVYQCYINPTSIILHRFLDLIYIYQHICFSGMLDLDYPVVYISFTLNFSWAIGLIPGFTAMQHAINNMRMHTGGNVDPTSSPSGTTNRKLSPYNAALSKTTSLSPNQPPAVGDTNMPATIVTSADALPAGIATYTNFLNISENNAFMTVFLTSLILLVILAILTTMVYGILFLIRRHKGTHAEPPPTSIAQHILVILSLVIFMPIAVFTFYQWTRHDSWLSILISVVTLLVVMAWLGFVSFATWKRVRPLFARTADDLPTSFRDIALIGPYKTSRRWLYLILLCAATLKSIFISFSQKSGAVQVGGLLVIEVFSLGILSASWPYEKKRSNILSIFLGCVKVLTIALLIPFVTRLSVKPIPRVVIGIVSAIILSVAVLITFIAIVLDGLSYRRPPSFDTALRSFSSSLEKTATTRDQSTDRPSNPSPSPSHSVPMSEKQDESSKDTSGNHDGHTSLPQLPTPTSYTSYGTPIEGHLRLSRDFYDEEVQNS